MWHPMTW